MPIQSTDTTSQIAFNADNQTWAIEGGVTVATDYVTSVEDAYSNTTLANSGTLLSGAAGVDVPTGTTHNHIINQASGLISGDFLGIILSASDSSVLNLGIITSENQGVFMGGAGSSIDNQGLISGLDTGVLFSSTNLDGGFLHNSGSIEGDAYGVLVSTVPTLVTTIHNSGSVSGATSIGDDAVYLGAADIDNSGVLDGKVDLEYATLACTIDNSGHIIGAALLGSGADLYDGRGGTVSGIVTGGDGADTLIGGSGDETLDGGAGRDKLDGGKGGGEDVFRFAAAPESSAKNPDLIARHWTAADLIDVSALDSDAHTKGHQDYSFGGKVAGAATALTPHEIQYYQAGGDTYVVADNSGDGKADFEVVIHGTFTLTAGEFVL